MKTILSALGLSLLIFTSCGDAEKQRKLGAERSR